MLIDEVVIKVRAGNGGDGCIAFNKNMMTLGPTGTAGGDGGNVYAEGVSDIGALRAFRSKKEFIAQDGKPGRSQFRDGERGEDLVMRVPIGTVIYIENRDEPLEVTKIGERALIARGGKGGRGNFHFRSSTNTSPRVFEPGKPGEHFQARLELKLIAHVGLIGLPNAGKSSLLNALTAASAKVANYPFTTLEPNLGVFNEVIIADIPGLIEGASYGKGLGTKFLRHIERTSQLFHLVSAESDNPLRDYKIIREELLTYNPLLLQKTEHIFLSKADLLTDYQLKQTLTELRKQLPNIQPLSVIDDTLMTKLKQSLHEIADSMRQKLE